MEKIRAAAYARYSSDNQRDESIDAQLRAISEFADKHNIVIVKTYIDRAKSATTDNRPEFLNMVNDSKLGLFNAVIIHKLDRFARNRYDSAIYKQKLKNNYVRVLSVIENLDDSPESIVTESVLEGMAEYYSKNLAREVMKGMKENALHCKHTGGKPPLGYNVDPKSQKYIINEDEAKIVRLIFKMYLDGFGYTEIIRKLNENGYKTKIGREFGKNSIHDILANEKYSGTYIFNKSTSKNAKGKRNSHKFKDESEIIKIQDGLPAIISKEDFNKAKSKMKKNKRDKATYKAKENYLLSGLIFCGECGHAFIGNVKHSGRNKLKYVTYRCGNRYAKQKCDNKEIRKEYIEEYVLQQLEEKIFSENAIRYFVNELNEYKKSMNSKSESETKDISTQINKTENEIANILKLVKQGYANSTLMNELTNLERVKANLESNLQEVKIKQEKVTVIDEKTIRKVLSVFQKFVHERNIPEIKKFIGQYVQRVEIFKDYIKVVLKSYIVVVTFGGGEGSRTPVRNHILKSFSGCIPQFSIPDVHPPRAGSTLP